jgi:hypothetical protein
MSNETILKDPGDRVDTGWTWTSWLDSDTISASTWTLPTGITSYSESNTTTETRIWLTGGTHGTDYLIMNQITTAGGRIKQRSIKVMVREQ